MAENHPEEPIKPENPVVSLQNSLADLVRESQALRGDLTKSNASRRRENLINLAATVSALIVVACVALLAYQNTSLSEQIRSCTSPAGACFQENRERTDQNRIRLIQATILTAVCHRTRETAEEIERCVWDKLDEHPTP